jgi:pimeloyl-ACP methyl ester carboxylesterase
MPRPSLAVRIACWFVVVTLFVAATVAIVHFTYTASSDATASAVESSCRATGQDGQFGDIIAAETVAVSPTLAAATGTACRITYASTDPAGNPITVTGLVLQPKPETKSQPGAGHVVAWAHGTTGLIAACAPSSAPEKDGFNDPFYPEAQAQAVAFLIQGNTVALTDYPGMNPAGDHPYLVGNSEARSVIDSVRAARLLDPTLSPDWAVLGHSEGGQAALFTGEIAADYGNELNLKGVVAIAPASNLGTVASAGIGSPANGYILMALYGLANVDPTVDPTAILSDEALAKVPGALFAKCSEDPGGALETFQDMSSDQLLKVPMDSPVWKTLIAKVQLSDPAQVGTPVPIRLVQGTDDKTQC